MVTLPFVFWMFVVFFAVIGAMRGWAKELLVSFSVVLAMFIITVLERYVPFVRDYIAQSSQSSQFWVRSALLLVLVFFGYQTPNLPRLSTSKFVREKLQDSLLGLFLGALNGYLIIGTLWFYLNEANYPFYHIIPPMDGDPVGEITKNMIVWMPPRLLGIPLVYFAVALSFVFILIVFL
jgi:uncharacterized membrane protein required for colicin V production